MLLWAVGPSMVFAQSEAPPDVHATWSQSVQLKAVVGPFVVPLRGATVALPSVADLTSPAPVATLSQPLLDEKATTEKGPAESASGPGAGITLQKLLMELGAQVEWTQESVGERIVSGNFEGSPETVARMVLVGINHVIIRDHGRLRIIVMGFERSVKNFTPAAPAQPQEIKEAQEVKQSTQESSKWTGHRHHKGSRRLPPPDSL
jgi:hypothetical protein